MKTLIVNWTLFLCGLATMSLGISIVTTAGIGTTPISALPLVSSYVSGLTFGQTTLIINVFFIFVQLILLRKNLRWTIFLQLPLTYFFAELIDFSMNTLSSISLESYQERLSFNMLGNMVLGLGVALEVFAKAAVLPGEGVVLAAAMTLRKPFPKMKIWNDVSLTLLAILLSLLVFKNIQGVREGTVISAITVGLFVKLWSFFLKKLPYRPESD